ncbi:MAG: amidohydrolase family protein, partial [Anaerolineales bacterium]|nr:amidohydrolase family protein [Anaerolineales bacterium]
IFGLYPRKGAMLPGSDADLVVVDMDKPWTLTADQLFQRNKHSAFVDYTFQAAVLQTIRRGETIYANGQIKARPGSGQLLVCSHVLT